MLAARTTVLTSVTALCLMLAGGCEMREGTRTFEMRQITLPDGAKVATEIAISPQQRAHGLMNRDSLPDGQGMLFVYEQDSRHAYWMEGVLFPLDIIWMDSAHHVLEVAPNAPPCKSGGQNCPTYGGQFRARYVLELPGGQAAQHGVKPGAVLQF